MKHIGFFNGIEVGIIEDISFDIKDCSILIISDVFSEEIIYKIIHYNPCVIYITGEDFRRINFLFDRLLYFQSYLSVDNNHIMTYFDDFFTEDTIFSFFWNAYPDESRNIKKYIIYSPNDKNLEHEINLFLNSSNF